MAGLELFGESLPENGGYYRIRNATSSTYIGGTGTGANSVILQSSSVDSLYQIFKITVNSSNQSFTMQQKESGRFMTHNNGWEGSWASKTGNNRQQFLVDNTTNVAYCIITKVTDGNSSDGKGPGYDDPTSGSTIWMDKGISSQNKWIFEPIISLSIADLDTTIKLATAMNPTALSTAITAASTYLTSTSIADISTAVIVLKAAMESYRINTLLESAKLATQDVPVDLTGLLINPGFEDGATGWTNSGFGVQNNDWPKKTGTNFIEKWVASTGSVPNVSISQTLSMKVPNGKYKFTATAQALQQGNTPPLATSPTGVSLYGGLVSIEVGDSALYTLDNIIVVDSVLTIGMKAVSATANWIAADDFKLYFQGVDLLALSNTLSTLVTTGGSITGVFQTAASTELAEAIAQANSVIASPEELALNASISRMNTAINTVNASIATYSSLLTSIGAVTDTVATYIGEEDKTTVNAAIALAQGIYDAHLLDVASTDAAKVALNSALQNFQMDNATEARPVILTSLLVNPGFDTNSGIGWTGASGAANYSEYELFGKSTLDFNQTITGLRKGQYKVTVQGFHRPGAFSDALEAAYDNGTEIMPVVLYANTKTTLFSSVFSDKTCSATSGTWIDANGILFANNMDVASQMFAAGKYGNNQVSSYVGGDGKLTLGLKNSGTPAGNSWTIFDNFQLSYIGVPGLAGYFEDLQNALADAYTVYNGINTTTQVSVNGEKTIGKYRYSDWFTLDSMLTVTDELINSYNNEEFTGEISDVLAVQTALNAAKDAMAIYLAKNELPNGEYYIKVADQFYWNNPGIDILANATTPGVGNSGLVIDLNVTDGSQIVTIAKLSGVDKTTPLERYSMFSLLDGRNITERCVFETNWGGSDDDWRTHNIYSNGNSFAVEGAGNSSGNGLWFYQTNDQTVTFSSIKTIADSFYVFNFIPVKTVFATEVPKGRTAFNSAVVGAEPEQYQQAIYNTFKTALEAAEAISVAGTATSSNLFAYEAALGSFLKNNEVAVKQVKDNSVSAIGGKRMIRVMSNNAEKVTIFSLTGSVVSSTVSAGTHDIAVDPGCYLVKINNRITKVIVK